MGLPAWLSGRALGCWRGGADVGSPVGAGVAAVSGLVGDGGKLRDVCVDSGSGSGALPGHVDGASVWVGGQREGLIDGEVDARPSALGRGWRYAPPARLPGFGQASVRIVEIFGALDQQTNDEVDPPEVRPSLLSIHELR
jgi:hypothetical protein